MRWTNVGTLQIHAIVIIILPPRCFSIKFYVPNLGHSHFTLVDTTLYQLYPFDIPNTVPLRTGPKLKTKKVKAISKSIGDFLLHMR